MCVCVDCSNTCATNAKSPRRPERSEEERERGEGSATVKPNACGTAMNGARMGRSNVGRVYARRTHRRRAHFDSHILRSHTNTNQHAIEHKNRQTNVRDQNNVQLSLRSLIIIIIVIVVVEALSSLSSARATLIEPSAVTLPSV